MLTKIESFSQVLAQNQLKDLHTNKIMIILL